MTQILIADERITLDERGLAYIDGTRIKVLNIAEETLLGRSPQEIQEAHSHLTLAQIHAALSYYLAIRRRSMRKSRIDVSL